MIGADFLRGSPKSVEVAPKLPTGPRVVNDPKCEPLLPLIFAFALNCCSYLQIGDFLLPDAYRGKVRGRVWSRLSLGPDLPRSAWTRVERIQIRSEDHEARHEHLVNDVDDAVIGAHVASRDIGPVDHNAFQQGRGDRVPHDVAVGFPLWSDRSRPISTRWQSHLSRRRAPALLLHRDGVVARRHRPGDLDRHGHADGLLSRPCLPLSS